MKFKTIVLSKNKFLLLCLVFMLVCIGVLTFTLLAKGANDAFCEREYIYKNILTVGLPNTQEQEMRFGDKLKKLFGIDLSEPKSIIEEYSAIFEGTTINDEEETNEPTEEDNAEINDEEYEEVQNSDEVPILTKEQISLAGDLKINNATDYNVDLKALCGEEFSINADGDRPKVLVVHTHTTECYDGDMMNGETERNTDEEKNIVAVGNEICRVLEENGIKTIHDTTYHDYPSYQGAYTRALSTIEAQLKENPSVEIVLDIHRDAFVYSDGSKLSVSCEVNGISTAQVMLVVGTNSMGLKHDDWQENLKLATKIQNAAEIMYPGLMRPINLRKERFNEHLTKGSLILEVGSNGNTLNQAVEGGKCVANAISAVLNAK